MFNAGFSCVKLSYKFDKFETNDVNTFEDIIRDQQVRGGIILAPLDTTFDDYDYLSPAAESIGVTSIVTKDPFGDLHGDNTEWIAILNLLKSAIEKLPQKQTKNVGIVLGTGSTAKAAAYALKQLSIKVKMCGSADAKTLDWADEFEIEIVDDLNSIDPNSISYFINTIPNTNEHQIYFKLLTNPLIVLMDTDYSHNSCLLSSASSGAPLIHGLEFLIEQTSIQWSKFVSHLTSPTSSPPNFPIKEVTQALLNALPNDLKGNIPNSLSKYLK